MVNVNRQIEVTRYFDRIGIQKVQTARFHQPGVDTLVGCQQRASREEVCGINDLATTKSTGTEANQANLAESSMA